MTKARKLTGKTLFLIVVFLFWFAQYTYIPSFTPYLTGLGIAASVAGNIVGAYGMAQLCLRIPFGVTADLMKNHKLFIALGFVAVTVASGILMFASTPGLFLLVRALAGVGASTWVSFTVFFTGFFEAEDTNRAMGEIMVYNNGGVFAAYILGGLMAGRLGVKSLFVLSVAAAVLGFFLVLLIPDTKAERVPIKLGSLLSVIKSGRLINCALLEALAQLIAFGTSVSFTANYARDLGAGAFELSIVSAIYTFGSLVSSRFITSKTAERLGDKVLCVAGFVSMGLYCFTIPMCTSMMSIYLCQLYGGFGRSFIMTLTMAGAVKYVRQEQRSTAMGIYQSIYSLGMTCGPMIMGLMLERFDYGPAFNAMAVFAAAGVVWTACSNFGKPKNYVGA